MLGADTRATEGDTVCDKNCEKIHYMAPNIYCCGAGTAADTEAVTGMVSGQLALHRYNTGRGSRVVTALTMLKGHLFKYQGQVSAALVLGGWTTRGHTCTPSTRTDPQTATRTSPWARAVSRRCPSSRRTTRRA